MFLFRSNSAAGVKDLGSVFSKGDTQITGVGGNLRPEADAQNLAVSGNFLLKTIKFHLKYIRITNTILAS